MNFRTPLLRLTLGYTAIIMCVSILFSVAIERVMANQVDTGLRHQVAVFQQRHFSFPLGFESYNDDLLEAQVREILWRTRMTLIFLNVGILLVGGTVSYWLARRTLRPIEAHLEAQRRFTADASHELRTPLTAMRTEIEVALRSKTLPAGEERKILHSTLEEVQRLEHLSRGLLRLSQYEEGDRELPLAPVSMKEATDEAIKKVNAMAQERNISISAETEGTVIADQMSLVELLVILLDNAIKYSPEHTTVAVRARPEGKKVVLTIADHGIGIKASDLPHIFDRFYRADTSRSKTKVDGNGLGLAIAKQIVDRHHGSMSADSVVGEGTTMTVVLPAAD